MTKEDVISWIKKSIATKEALIQDDQAIATIARVAQAAVEVLKKDRKLLIAGNGGSAADAQHMACELVNRLNFDRPALPAIALTTDTSVLTAIGNDSGYDLVFSRQIEALGRKGDMFLGISTSGNAPNIINAFNVCKNKGIMRVGLTGLKGGAMDPLCELCIRVPANKTPLIQESHIMICHILCGIIEQKIFGS